MENRIEAAKGLAKEFHEDNCPILVDFMEDKLTRSMEVCRRGCTFCSMERLNTLE